MPYNFAAESFHTKKLCSRLSSRKVQFFMTDGQTDAHRRPRLHSCSAVKIGLKGLGAGLSIVVPSVSLVQVQFLGATH